MTLWIDAAFAYLHFTAIILLFAFLSVEVMLMRGALEPAAIRLLGRVDLGLFLAVAVISVQPTLSFIRWRRVPFFAVIMARGLGR